MRIIQVSPYFYPHIGGVESHVLDLSHYLMKRGHEVEVITSNYAKLPEYEKVMGISVRRVKALTVKFSTPVTPAMKKVISGEKADIVHSHSPPPLQPYYAAKGSKKARIPHVLTYHCDLEIPIPGGRHLVSAYRRTFGKKTISMSDEIIATTQSYASTSRDIWHRDIRVIPNAVDERRFNPKVSGKKVREELGIEGNMVLYVGRLVYHKGVEYLIDSAKEVEAKYVIVGTGPKEKELRKHAVKAGVSEKVMFAGKVPYARLPEYYAATDVFVLPSVSRLEAFGIVTMEAMATGKPVIVSDIPGVNEVIEDGVHGFNAVPMDGKDIARKLRTLLSDEDLRKEMGMKGRKLVEERYTWDRVVEMVEQVYRDILERR